MEMTELINHPERMDRDTLYELRSMLALYPYFQTARLLMLQNLYLLHDPAFDEELRRAAIYITDRKTIFQMIEAAHYQLRQQLSSNTSSTSPANTPASRTIDLIDTFLDSIPQDEPSNEKPKRNFYRLQQRRTQFVDPETHYNSYSDFGAFVFVPKRSEAVLAPTFRNKWTDWSQFWFYHRVCSDALVSLSKAGGQAKANSLVSVLSPLSADKNPDFSSAGPKATKCAEAFLATSARQISRDLVEEWIALRKQPLCILTKFTKFIEHDGL